jgi:D-lactate dehydrogenase
VSPTEVGTTARLSVHARDLLEAAVPGGLGWRAVDRLSKAHDASHYVLIPEVVATPRGIDETAALMRACREVGVPLTFRSGGTSLSGQAGSEHVLVDTRRHFREITVLDGGERVRVQPGATVRQVNARLAPYATKLGPDPASEGACTLGGVIANNSSGMACGTELNTYQTIESAVLVLASGTVIDTGDDDADARLRELEPELHAGLVRLMSRVRGNPTSVGTIRRQFQLKNTMGYGLNAFLDFARPVDVLLHLVVGSEGTLAFVAEATMRTVPTRPWSATGLLMFDSLHAATRVLPDLVAAKFATIELMDATSLRVCQRDPSANAALSGQTISTHAALLVEYQESTQHELELRLDGVRPLMADLGFAQRPVLSTDPSARASLWRLRKGLYAAVAGSRPSGTTALLEDIAVPVPSLADVCQQLISMFDVHGYEDSVIFGHARDGNIHFLLNERFDQPDRLERYQEFTEEMVDLVLGRSGNLKAEHGTGRIMAPFVRRQYGDELYDVMVELKTLLDPTTMLNPGVIINQDPRAHLVHLKTAHQVEAEVDRCVECGFCEPVCPSKDLTLTPRDRIVLRREIAKAEQAGDHALVEQLRGDYKYDGIDTCAADGMCQTACPVHIDTGSLVRRLRAERSAPILDLAWSTAARHWGASTRAGSAALSLAKLLPDGVATRATSSARQVLGDEDFPAWSPELPGGGRQRSRVAPAEGPADAVHFAACTGAMFGAADGGGGAASAFATLCERVGLTLRVPQNIDALCCGTPWKSKGHLRGLSSMQNRVVAALWRASEQGRLPVVCDASSCTEGLLELCAERGITVVDSVSFVLARVVPKLEIVTRADSVAVHPTCSSARMGTTDALLAVAGAASREVDLPSSWGCCGFAGDRGLLHPELTASATAEEADELAGQHRSAYVSCNRTCELGMTRATGETYVHVLELLEQASRPLTDGEMTS